MYRRNISITCFVFHTLSFENTLSGCLIWQASTQPLPLVLRKKQFPLKQNGKWLFVTEGCASFFAVWVVKADYHGLSVHDMAKPHQDLKLSSLSEVNNRRYCQLSCVFFTKKSREHFHETNLNKPRVSLDLKKSLESSPKWLRKSLLVVFFSLTQHKRSFSMFIFN